MTVKAMCVQTLALTYDSGDVKKLTKDAALWGLRTSVASNTTTSVMELMFLMV